MSLLRLCVDINSPEAKANRRRLNFGLRVRDNESGRLYEHGLYGWREVERDGFDYKPYLFGVYNK